MKCFRGLILFVLMSCSAAAQLVLSEGQSYVGAFNTMSVNSGLHYNAAWHAYIGFSGDLFDFGDVLKVDLYESSALGSPFLSSQINGQAMSSPSVIWFGSDEHWGDYEGAVVLTVLTGSVGVSNITVENNAGSQAYSAMVSVPEPHTFEYLFLGIIALFGSRVWRLGA